MIKLDIENSRWALALFLERKVLVFSFLRKTFLALSLVLLLGFILNNSVFYSPLISNSKLLGFLILSLIVLTSSGYVEFFYRSCLLSKDSQVPLELVLKNFESYNLADFLDYDLAKIILKSQKFNLGKRRRPLDTSLILYSLLYTPAFKFVALRLALDLKELDAKLREHLASHIPKLSLDFPIFSPDLVEALRTSFAIALKKGKKLVSIEDFISALPKHNQFFKEFLIEKEIKEEHLENLCYLRERILRIKEKRSRFWEEESLALFGSIGRDLASAYTITLDQYGIDLTKQSLRYTEFDLIGHEPELEELERSLNRTINNNVILVGRPGSGRKRIVLYFARMSYFGRLKQENLNYKRVVLLNLPSLIAQVEDIETAEVVLDKIFKEVAKANNVILVIDNFHEYVSSVQKPGVLNIAGLLSSYLSRADFQVIALTTFAGFHSEIEKRPALLNYFTKIEVRELEPPEVLRVLEDWLPIFEAKYRKVITYQALTRVVENAQKYLPDTAFPKKAIDLLDQVMVYSASLPQHPFVTPEDVDYVTTQLTEIPVGKIKEKERELLLNLEKVLHQRIIDQEEAIKEISEALRRARTEITIRKGPIGTFLFLGPTGVGKTETCKALAEVYFGSEERMIRIDMSEFQKVDDIPRLIGGKGMDGILTTQVRENPFSLVLLDEIEKAHPNILNLFLQILDEGYVTDGYGRKVNFKNTIIIGTSNAGAEIIWEDVRQDKKLDLIKEDLFAYLFKKGLFRPEFLNRFDAVIVYKPLEKHHLLEIAKLMFKRLAENLKKQEIELFVSPKALEKVVELGYNPAFGAREMRRVIQDKVENLLAVALLEGKIKRGDKVLVEIDLAGNFELKKQIPRYILENTKQTFTLT